MGTPLCTHKHIQTHTHTHIHINKQTNTETFLQIQKSSLLLIYEGKLLEIQKLFDAWSKRYLTPLGKIGVIKSLVVSKITYLTMDIPDPSEGFIQELKKNV